MTVDIVFLWVIGTIYRPFLLMKINFNKKSVGSWNITVDDVRKYITGMFLWLQKFLSLALLSLRCLSVFRLSFR